MRLSEDLVWRGLIKDKTFENESWLDSPKTFYLGKDASASSLTVGNLAIILLARRLCAAGWKTTLLIGGGTSLVGDPGGKVQERELKKAEEVEENIASIRRQIVRLFAGKQFELLNNFGWLHKLGYLEFLRDIGKHFSMTELMQREFVAERMNEGGNGISYAEFSYSLIQGYDFWHLFKDKGVELQIGGSDQWGNMLSGVSLIRKKEAKEAHALSMPLVVDKSTGQKFGKSESGAVWLDADMTPPPEFYQFWVNTADADVEAYLKVFTFLDKQEVEGVVRLHENDPAKRSAQRRLADAVTVLVHQEAGLAQARLHAESIRGGSVGAEAVPLKSGVSVIDALVQTGLATSNSDARRIIDEGGVYVDNEHYAKVTLDANGRVVLRRGKKLSNSVLIELK